MTQATDCRSSITDALRLLSSPDRQLAYERNVPNISAPTELLCRWFDDTYLPESQVFSQSFSAEELAAMSAFDDFYDERSKLLPEPTNGIADWLSNENWQQIMRQASDLLERLSK